MIRIAAKFDKTRIALLLGTKFKLVVAKPHEAQRLISLVLTLPQSDSANAGEDLTTPKLIP